MLLTLTNTQPPATDLGFLLHKHPDRAQRYSLSFGATHVFYPEAGEARCTACLLVDVDPVELVRGKSKAGGGLLDQYVNDRPYAASSFLSVAIGQVFSTALAGRCAARPELAAQPLPLTAHLPVTPACGDEDLVPALFEPLGYEVEMARLPLDERFPDWGDSPYVSLTLSATVTVKDLLSHHRWGNVAGGASPGPQAALCWRSGGSRSPDAGCAAAGDGGGEQRQWLLRGRQSRSQAGQSVARPPGQDQPRPGRIAGTTGPRIGRLPRRGIKVSGWTGQPLCVRRRPATGWWTWPTRRPAAAWKTGGWA